MICSTTHLLMHDSIWYNVDISSVLGYFGIHKKTNSVWKLLSCGCTWLAASDGMGINTQHFYSTYSGKWNIQQPGHCLRVTWRPGTRPGKALTTQSQSLVSWVPLILLHKTFTLRWSIKPTQNVGQPWFILVPIVHPVKITIGLIGLLSQTKMRYLVQPMSIQDSVIISRINFQKCFIT